MKLNSSEAFFIALFIIFTIPYLVWRVFNTDKYAPLVVVQIISGILLGPSIIGSLLSKQYEAIFTPDVLTALGGVAKLAVVAFVWTAGVELSLKEAIENKRETAVTAGFALLVPLLFGSIAAFILSGDSQWIGKSAHKWQFILGVGMATAVTALPILVLILEKLNILNTEFGKRIIRYASLDDIVIWTVLAIILLDWERIVRQGIFIVTYAASAILLRRVFNKMKDHRDKWALAISWMVLIAFISDWSGLHYMVGGFLAGAVIDKEWFKEEELKSFRNNVLVLIMPVFFLITGLRTDWGNSSIAVLIVASLMVITSVSGKIVGVQIAGKINRWQKGEAYSVGLFLQTKGLIEIIFCTILLDRGVISQSMFTALVIMAVVSTMITVPAVSNKLKTVIRSN
jgi:Kef-type K+ transport system membrane component KefB